MEHGRNKGGKGFLCYGCSACEWLEMISGGLLVELQTGIEQTCIRIVLQGELSNRVYCMKSQVGHNNTWSGGYIDHW